VAKLHNDTVLMAEEWYYEDMIKRVFGMDPVRKNWSRSLDTAYRVLRESDGLVVSGKEAVKDFIRSLCIIKIQKSNRLKTIVCKYKDVARDGEFSDLIMKMGFAIDYEVDRNNSPTIEVRRLW
jgi:hypothetical protein